MWVRRLILLMIILGIWPAYRLGDYVITQRHVRQAREQALVTAKVWVATATFRKKPARFARYRDSLIAAHGLSREQMSEYLHLYEDHPEDYDLFARLVKQYVDSLCPEFSSSDTLPPRQRRDRVRDSL